MLELDLRGKAVGSNSFTGCVTDHILKKFGTKDFEKKFFESIEFGIEAQIDQEMFDKSNPKMLAAFFNDVEHFSSQQQVSVHFVIVS